METQQIDRTPELVRLERDSFILLQHLYTLTDGDVSRRVTYPRLGEELGFGDLEAAILVHHLATVGYLSPGGPTELVSLTPLGIDYIERLAWRRRSVRQTVP